MKRKHLFFLCFAFGLVSCVGQNLQKQFERFIAKEIIVPNDMRQIVGNRDSVVLNTNSGIARFVVYTASLSCSSCRLKMMSDYAVIIDHRKEVDDLFVPLFVFSPRVGQSTEIRNTLLLYRFDYPILLDEKGLFPAANPHIPADNRLHTFLIDRNGKVVLVGNPVNNPPLWELYKTTITTLIENGGTMPEVEK
jgi:hypothetical protein